jgi:L-arabinokinase
MRLAAYITGHGFGHATRTIEILNAVGRRDPGREIHIRTMVPERILHYYMHVPFAHSRAMLDVGAAEKGILDVNIEETWRMWEPLLAREEQTLAEEVDFLRGFGADAVFFDIPPLAAVAAARVGIPSIGCSNFSWDFIYEQYIPRVPAFRGLVQRIRDQCAQTTLALQLPLGHTMTAFPRRHSIPLVARKSTADPSAVRRELGVGSEETLVLLALRGSAIEGLGLLRHCRGFRFVSFGEVETDDPHILQLRGDWQDRFRDVLAASDVVLSKPGYGVVSECIAHQRPLVHLRRRDFAEQDLLIEGMDPHIPHRQLDVSDLSPEVLERAIEEVQADRKHLRPAPVNGAEIAAESILAEHTRRKTEDAI